MRVAKNIVLHAALALTTIALNGCSGCDKEAAKECIKNIGAALDVGIQEDKVEGRSRTPLEALEENFRKTCNAWKENFKCAEDSSCCDEEMSDDPPFNGKTLGDYLVNSFSVDSNGPELCKSYGTEVQMGCTG
mmetsp:Transcript_149805/g.261173  ORF Transcript_149805/g.261173 Transcript_149805/m.261173 type:complete len:133 (-) Transcript_149805:22-420(-)